MRRFPSLVALRAFEAAARLESFALASEELHQTPSAISHQIRALESYFERGLFQRHRRRVELTPDGQRLLTQLSNAFDVIEAACAELSPLPRAQSLAVHCAPSFASKWLGPRLPSFTRQHPTISIRLSSSAEPIDLVRREDLDLAIAYGAALHRPGIVAEPLGTELIAALCSPTMASQIDAADPASMSRLTLIESTLSPVRWSDWFVLNDLFQPSLRNRPSFDRGALAISAAVQGAGVALETTRLAEEELKKGELVQLGNGRFQGISREMHFLCYRAVDKDKRKTVAFRAWLFSQAAPEVTRI